MKFKEISRRIKITSLILFLSLLVLAGYSRAGNLPALDVRTVTIDLSTNMVCGTARKIINKALKKIDGVIEADVETVDRVAVVTYDDSRTSLAELETAITNVGYDANDQKGDPEAYQ